MASKKDRPESSKKAGVLLLNLGSPDSPSVGDIKKYLAEFLGDPKVIDLPAPFRQLLVKGVILPFRSPKTAEAYQKIWTEEGSPLVIQSRKFTAALQEHLPDTITVSLGMRYGSPSTREALEQLAEAGVEKLILFPLYPHCTGSTTGTALEEAKRHIASMPVLQDLPVLEIPPFFKYPGYIHALGLIGRHMLIEEKFDHVLFSFHGLPLRHVKRETNGQCLKPDWNCCEKISENPHCYRAQCVTTANHTAQFMGLERGKYSITFQSRLGGGKWLSPYTDAKTMGLAKAGVRKLLVISPSFVADCLETLEEIGIRLRERFLETGGEKLVTAPCLNDNGNWVHAAKNLILETLEKGGNEV